MNFAPIHTPQLMSPSLTFDFSDDLRICSCCGESYYHVVIKQQQNLGRRFGACKLYLSPPAAKAAVCSKAVVLLLLTFCLLLLPLWESVIVLCFVVRYLCPF